MTNNIEFFTTLNKKDKKKILEKACSYNDTLKDYGEKNNNPVIVQTIEYNNLKDDFKNISDVFSKNPIFNKYSDSDCYVEIINVLKDDEDFNADQTDAILINKHNYSVMLKNINNAREYPGTTLSISIDVIVNKCYYYKKEIDDKIKNENCGLSVIIIGVSLLLYGMYNAYKKSN